MTGAEAARPQPARRGVALLIALVVSLTACYEPERAWLLFEPLDLVVGEAVIDATVASVWPMDSRFEQALVLQDIEIRWQAEEMPMDGGERHPVPVIPVSGDFRVRAWAYHTYEAGQRYHFFLGGAVGWIPPVSPWRAQFALSTDGQVPVAGTEEGTVEELRAILSVDEDPTTGSLAALLELSIERLALREASNVGLAAVPGPRTERLLAHREFPAAGLQVRIPSYSTPGAVT